MSLVFARPPRVDVIVCEDLSRVTRDFADGATLFKHLQFAGVPLIGIADNIDTASPSSKMNYGLKALMSEQYVDDLRFRTKRGLDGRALKDYSTGGLPIGYCTEPVTVGGEVVGHNSRFLQEINSGRSIDCLPHGLYPTKMIGNNFLYFLDTSSRLRSHAIVRFMDDYHLFDDDESVLIDDFMQAQKLLGD
jgi:DNA invertase Pin-like site-specific DNA recombinase